MGWVSLVLLAFVIPVGREGKKSVSSKPHLHIVEWVQVMSCAINVKIGFELTALHWHDVFNKVCRCQSQLFRKILINLSGKNIIKWDDPNAMRLANDAIVRLPPIARSAPSPRHINDTLRHSWRPIVPQVDTQASSSATALPYKPQVECFSNRSSAIFQVQYCREDQPATKIRFVVFWSKTSAHVDVVQ